MGEESEKQVRTPGLGDVLGIIHDGSNRDRSLSLSFRESTFFPIDPPEEVSGELLALPPARWRLEQTWPDSRRRLTVVNQESWWFHDGGEIAYTNFGDKNLKVGIHEFVFMISPWELCSALRWVNIESIEFIGREAWRCEAVPLTTLIGEPDIRLAVLGFEADTFELIIDTKTGMILYSHGMKKGRTVGTRTVTRLELDAVLSPTLFVFDAPQGVALARP
jgi:hypothetical protein